MNYIYIYFMDNICGSASQKLAIIYRIFTEFLPCRYDKEAPPLLCSSSVVQLGPKCRADGPGYQDMQNYKKGYGHPGRVASVEDPEVLRGERALREVRRHGERPSAYWPTLGRKGV